jgi:AGZA family xanthine/uracil permease-like MFS transporter
MLWGNLYYVYMARKLAYKEKRGDVCTMPYGINTPGACKRIYFQ